MLKETTQATWSVIKISTFSSLLCVCVFMWAYWVLLVQVHTVCVGAAIGQACLLLSAGTKGKRFMMPHAKGILRLHSGRPLRLSFDNERLWNVWLFMLQLWSSNLVCLLLVWCLPVMSWFVPKRFDKSLYFLPYSYIITLINSGSNFSL